METESTKTSSLKTWILRILGVLFISSFLALGQIDLLVPVKDFLTSEPLTFSIADNNYSAYTVIKALIIIIILVWVTGIISRFGDRRIAAIHGIKASNKSLLLKAFHILIYFIAFLICLDVLGVDLTAFTIFSGAVGIGIGFGLQKITSNFISGIILLFEKSVESDDLVELADGTFGFIRHTGARYTLIETFDGKEIMIPNEDFITSRVTNWTYSNNNGRIEILIGVSYDSDIEKAREIILESAKSHPRCIDEPEPACFLTEFADSSVNFQLFFWVSDVTEGRLEPKSDVLRVIWREFEKNNITIPFPQRDVHIKSSGGLKS